MRGSDATEDATQGQSDDAHRAIDDAHRAGREAESSLRYRVEKEGVDDLDELRLGQSEEQHEEQGGDDVLLHEERTERQQRLAQDATHRVVGGVAVGGRSGERPGVVEAREEEEDGEDGEDHRPGERYLARMVLYQSRDDDEQSLSRYGGDAIERAAYADEERLLVAVEAVHVEAVGRDVVGSRREGHQPEERQREPEEKLCGDEEGDAREGDGEDRLHGDDPPPLGADEIDHRAPKGLDDPRQVEPACIEGDVRIGDAHLLVEDDGYRHHGDVGQSLGKIEGGHPRPRVDMSLAILGHNHCSMEGL